eukprot:1335598-Amorphochlora_amoeboformis.AAC.1
MKKEGKGESGRKTRTLEPKPDRQGSSPEWLSPSECLKQGSMTIIFSGLATDGTPVVADTLNKAVDLGEGRVRNHDAGI